MSFLQKYPKLLLLFAFASIYVIWGSTFLAIAYGLRGFPPFLLSGLRFIIAGIILLTWRYFKGERTSTFKDWKKNGITGILILTGGTGLVTWGEQYISSTEAAIAIATGPFWFIAIDRKNWKVYFSSITTIAGLIIGFAGLLLFLNDSIHTVPGSSAKSMRLAAFIVLALSSVSWVLGSLYSKHQRASHSTFKNIAQQLVVAGIASFIIAAFRGEWQDFPATTIPREAWLGLTFLVFLGSIVAYLSYIWLLSVKPPVIVSTHTYINPVVAVFAGWLFLQESITTLQLAGLIVILSGVLLTNVSAYKVNKRRAVRVRRTFRILFSNHQTDKYLVDF